MMKLTLNEQDSVLKLGKWPKRKWEFSEIKGHNALYTTTVYCDQLLAYFTLEWIIPIIETTELASVENYSTLLEELPKNAAINIQIINCQ